MHCYIEYMADVLTVGDLEERVALVDKLMQDDKIASVSYTHLDVYKRQIQRTRRFIGKDHLGM